MVLALFAVAGLILRANWALLTSPTGRERSGQAIVGAKAPDLKVVDLRGRTLRLSQFEGRPLVINFFATWCPPCRAELPELERRYLAHAKKHLGVVGVDQQERAGDVERFVRAMGVSFPVVIDPGPGAITYDVSQLPISIFVDSAGTVRFIRIGQLTPNDLDTGLRSIM